MKRALVLGYILLSLVVYAQSGATWLQPEHQAYALCMGLESGEEGVIVSVLCPSISGSDSASYQLFAASGQNTSEALDSLRESVPRNLLFTQLKALLLNEPYASGAAMDELVYGFLLNSEFYADARVFVCSWSPSAFLEQYRPVIGARLSASIQASVENSLRIGSAADVHLADLIEAWNNPFADPVALIADAADAGESKALLANGTALFSNHRYSGRLDAEETGLLRWLRGDVIRLTLHDGPSIVSLIPDSRPSIDIDPSKSVIHVGGSFSQENRADRISSADAEAMLTGKLRNLVEKSRALNAEPFLFTEKGKKCYQDLPRALSSDLRLFCRTAPVEFQVSIRRSAE